MKQLDQRLVTRYAKYAALKNLLEAWLKSKREQIVKALEGGASCPTKGPYLLELGEAEARPNWKEEFRAWLVRSGLSEETADGELEKIADRERPKEPRLYSKANPNFGRKVEIRLPAA